MGRRRDHHVPGPQPGTGSPVTFDVAASQDCGPNTYTYTVDGVQQPPQAAPAGQSTTTFTTTFSTTGSHTVSATTGFPAGSGCSPETGSTTITVGAGVGGPINLSPDPTVPGQSTVVSVTPSGGLGEPYVGYRWTIDGVADPAGNDKRSYARTFTAGTHTIAVTFSDDPADPNTNPQHTGPSTRTIDVEAPAPPAPGRRRRRPRRRRPRARGRSPSPSRSSRPAAASRRPGPTRTCGDHRPGQAQRHHLRRLGPADHHHRPDDGRARRARQVQQRRDPDRPVRPLLGQHGLVAAGGPGRASEGTLAEVAVPSFTRLFKLRVAGSIAIKLGIRGDGSHYASFPLNVELPPAFTAGPSKFSGGVSGAASISVDDNGIHYDGLKVSVTDVWVGSLRVASACFSYVPAGGQAVEPCAAPELDGKPYIQCATDVTTDRFDGSAVIELPTASSTRLAAFGGLAGGEVSKLGGFVDDLGTTLPIVPGVFLNRVGVGLCLSPPPFKLRGDVGVTALGGKLAVNGHVLYTDATDTTPWSVDVGGNVAFNGTQLGDATVGFNAWGDVNFDVNAALDLGDVASLTGNVNGWIEPRNRSFTIAGTVQGCIDGLGCDTASALVSNVGHRGLPRPRLDHDRRAQQRQGGAVRLRLDRVHHAQGDDPPAGRRRLQVRRQGRPAGRLVRPLALRRHAQRDHGAGGGGRRGPLGAGPVGSQGGDAARPRHARRAEDRGARSGRHDDHVARRRERRPEEGPLHAGRERLRRHDERAARQAGRRDLDGDGRAGRRVDAHAHRPRGVPGAVGPVRADAQGRRRPSGRGGVRGARRRVGEPRRARQGHRPHDRQVGARHALPRREGAARRSHAEVRAGDVHAVRPARAASARSRPWSRAAGSRSRARRSRPSASRARRGRRARRAARAPRRQGRGRRVPEVARRLELHRDGGRSATAARLGFDLAGSCRAVRIPAVAKDDAVRFKVAGVRYDLQTGATPRSRWPRTARRPARGGRCRRGSAASEREHHVASGATCPLVGGGGGRRGR